MNRAIVICTTCKFADGRKTDADGRSAGQILLGEVRSALSDAGRSDIVIEEQACLWNCTRPCSVVFRDSTRFSYVTGGHAPTRSQAEAITQWFDLHGSTATGEVPFRQWPDAMRGHFIARIPPVRP